MLKLKKRLLPVLTTFLACCAAKAEVYLYGETKSGKKITVYLDYNTYGAGSFLFASKLTVKFPDGSVKSVDLGGAMGGESDVREHSVQVFKIDGKWQLMAMFKTDWEAGLNHLEVRYLAKNFEGEGIQGKGVKNGINSLTLDWEEAGLKGVRLTELRGSGVPGDEFELDDLE